MTDSVFVPCENCGAEVVDGKDTTVSKTTDFQFNGVFETRDYAAKVCPECEEVTIL